MVKRFTALGLALFLSLTGVFAQTDNQVRNVSNGQKMKVEGVVVAKDNERIVVRDATGVDTNVTLTNATSIKTKGGIFGGGDRIGMNGIVRGLNLEVEGRGDNSGSLVANKVRFGKTDLRVAQSIESRVAPAEERL